MIITSTTQMRYRFRESELVDVARQQARAIERQRAEEEALALVKKEAGGRIQAAKSDIDACNRRIMAGYEMRDVTIMQLRFRPGRNEVAEVRTDTGEVTRIRTLYPDERQMTIVEEGQEPERYRWRAVLPVASDAEGVHQGSLAWSNGRVLVPLYEEEYAAIRDVLSADYFDRIEDDGPVALIEDGSAA